MMLSQTRALCALLVAAGFVSCDHKPDEAASDHPQAAPSLPQFSETVPAVPVENLPVWTPREDLLASLDAESSLPDVRQYSIRLPAEHQFVVRPDSNAERKFIAAFPRNSSYDEIPRIRIFVGLPPPGQETKYTLQQASDVMLRKDSQQFRDWSQEPSAAGIVNGLRVVRTPWRGTDQKDNAPLRGVTYAAFDGTAILNLTALIPASETDDALALVESALLTFRRSDAPAR